MPRFYDIQCARNIHLPANTLIHNSPTNFLTRCVYVCVTYGWSSTSHNRLAGQEVVEVEVAVLVGSGVVLG